MARPQRIRIGGTLARLLSGHGLVPGQMINVAVSAPDAGTDYVVNALYRVEAIIASRTARGDDVTVVVREAPISQIP